ncbi:MAG: hypothetical protein ACLUNZ_10410 [Evtepia sp.]
MGISSDDLAAAIPGAKAAANFAQLTDWLYDMAQPGDLILTVGAGDTYTVGEAPGSAGPGKPDQRLSNFAAEGYAPPRFFTKNEKRPALSQKAGWRDERWKE